MNTYTQIQPRLWTDDKLYDVYYLEIKRSMDRINKQLLDARNREWEVYKEYERQRENGELTFQGLYK